MSLIIDGDIGAEISRIANRISEEYNVSPEKMDLIIQFEYSQHLKVDKLKTENTAKTQTFENMANELLGYSLIYGLGKCSSASLPADPRRYAPKYKFMCDYVIFSKEPIIIRKERNFWEMLFNKKRKIDDSLMICTNKEDLYYFYIGELKDDVNNAKSSISDLNTFCGCEDRGCSLTDYFDINEIHQIDEASFCKQIELALSEKLPQYPEISTAIRKDIIPLTKNAMDDIFHQMLQNTAATDKAEEDTLRYFV